MDPISALSIATGIVAFIDFGGKLIKLFIEVRKSEAGRPDVLSSLEVESRDLSKHAADARARISTLRTRYPRQAESFTRLDAECRAAETELRNLVSSLTAQPGTGRARMAVAFRGLLKQGDLKDLITRLRKMQEQIMMNVVMCIWDDVSKGAERLEAIDGGVGEVSAHIRRLKRSVKEMQKGPKHRLPLQMSLWKSISAADELSSGTIPVADRSINPDLSDTRIRRLIESLRFDNMAARRTQIKDPFPETFQWLLTPESDGSREPTGFQTWLESEETRTPFWVTGVPASGKSTLMKFICTNDQVGAHLARWAGQLPLFVCSAFLWNPGTTEQKTQSGLLRTILYQLLEKQPDLWKVASPKRHLYYDLAGSRPWQPYWSVEELRRSILEVVSQLRHVGRLALFIDGLDEYDGDLADLVAFLKNLHQHHGAIKLCVSSRNWNVFRDAFSAYPILKMEEFTRPDIEKYVRARMADSPAFDELRSLGDPSVQGLESRIIEKANGVFLWVVLVVEKLIITAQNNNDPHELDKIVESLPPGLDELYNSIRKRLPSDLRETASKMYQLVFCWSESRPFSLLAAHDFWMAIQCRDLFERQKPSQGREYLAVLERRMAGATGGMLQIIPDESRPRVDFLHRTVFDWLQSIRVSIVDDGPPEYDPSLVLVSGIVQKGFPRTNYRISHCPSLLIRIASPILQLGLGIPDELETAFAVGRQCGDSPANRATLLRIFDHFHFRPVSFIYRRGGYWAKFPPSAEAILTAIRYSCVPYVRAQFEKGCLGTGLGFPRLTYSLPTRAWATYQRSMFIEIFDALGRSKHEESAMQEILHLCMQARIASDDAWRDMALEFKIPMYLRSGHRILHV
ncbi:P-loop containing nucleoside triphosphate hydrolase [Echria macrotheca]|uniref:P-loop containing nucleoside triphosphate hydrolase n=1 Tax=Echria macrotheca TaxID=438768 RepID=A0AAJ0F801_9PEZI|nr:P-loop containing nucleoside triphosphate hydrolase [Echria macrotheca]